MKLMNGEGGYWKVLSEEWYEGRLDGVVYDQTAVWIPNTHPTEDDITFPGLCIGPRRTNAPTEDS